MNRAFLQVSDASPSLTFGTPLFRLDLVDADIKLATTLNTRAVKRSFFTFPNPEKPGSFASVNIVGPLAELDFVTRNNDVSIHYVL